MKRKKVRLGIETLFYGLLILSLVSGVASFVFANMHRPNAAPILTPEPALIITRVPLGVEFGFPTPTPTRTPQYDEWGRVQQSVRQIMGVKNIQQMPAPVGSIEGNRCQGQTHDMSGFGVPGYTFKHSAGFSYSKYAYVLELDGTVHICTEAGELIH